MKRKIILTEDGSHTLYVSKLDENYHSGFGAVAESKHIFIEAGLKQLPFNEVQILEIGFGTGLNAYLSLHEAVLNARKISYDSLEKYPLIKDEYQKLNYKLICPEIHKGEFELLHSCEWEQKCRLNNYFELRKIKTDLKNFHPDKSYNLVYFDAFAPDLQPDLWSKEIFMMIYDCLIPGALLLTYSVKGWVRRNLTECGFRIEKIPGPKGKRQILRARK